MNADTSGLATGRLGPAGLSGAQAAERLLRDGPNELPQDGHRGPLRIVLEAMREPMLQLLLVSAGLYVLLGDLTEGLVLLGFAVLNILLVVVQESRTERTLAALRDLTSPRALVVRDGERRRIAGRDVVLGDILVLSEGDRVPADAVLLEASDLQADESLLTGESVPVRKAVGDCRAEPMPGGDGTPHTGGQRHPHCDGPRTAIGKIGRSLGRGGKRPHPAASGDAQAGPAVRGSVVTSVVAALGTVLINGTLAAGLDQLRRHLQVRSIELLTDLRPHAVQWTDALLSLCSLLPVQPRAADRR